MVPALLTHKKLEREAAVKAVTDEVAAKLIAKFGAEKVTESVLARGLLLHPKGNRARLDHERKQAPGWPRL